MKEPTKRKPKPMPVYLTLRMMVDPATGQQRAAFVAASEADSAILRERGYKLNTKVRAELKQPRNHKFNSLVHGLGALLTNNLDRFTGMQAHQAVKALQMESAVYCDREEFDIPGLGLLMRMVPQSLSFDSMGEEVFQDFWRQCCSYLVATDWPTLTAERLTEMAEFESFREAA